MLSNDLIEHIAMRNLAAAKTIGHNQFMVVQDKRNLRGIDYRAPGPGIALLIGNTFTRNRLFNQALGRLGIFCEPFERAQVSGTLAVNEKTDTEALNALFVLLNSIK